MLQIESLDNLFDSIPVSIFNFLWKHDRFCETVKPKIDYETQYAEYELSKEAVRAEKRRKQIQKIKAGCEKLFVICAIIMLLGEFSLFFLILVWFLGLSILGIVVAASSQQIITTTQAPTTTPKTTTTTETPIPKSIELKGNLNFNRGFEILGKYNLIAYTMFNAPVYERIDYQSSEKIYFYHECEEWMVTPYYDSGKQWCPLRWLWKESSGSFKLTKFWYQLGFSELNPINLANNEPIQFSEITSFDLKFSAGTKMANITIVPVNEDQ